MQSFFQIFKNNKRDRNLPLGIIFKKRVIHGTVFLLRIYLWFAKPCSRGTTPEPSSVTTTTRSLIPTPTSKDHRQNSMPSSIPTRKAQPVHRSRTTGTSNDKNSSGAPLEPVNAGLADSPRTPSPTKSKLNFLEGFRNTLRARSPVRIGSVPVSTNTRKNSKNSSQLHVHVDRVRWSWAKWHL